MSGIEAGLLYTKIVNNTDPYYVLETFIRASVHKLFSQLPSENKISHVICRFERLITCLDV